MCEFGPCNWTDSGIVWMGNSARHLDVWTSKGCRMPDGSARWRTGTAVKRLGFTLGCHRDELRDFGQIT